MRSIAEIGLAELHQELSDKAVDRTKLHDLQATDPL